MSKQKISIITLFVAFVFCMAAMCISFGISYAEGSVDSNSVFTTLGGASKKSENEEYLAYKVGDEDNGDAVVLRRNLALKWYSFDGEAAVGGAHGARYFSLAFAFESTDFDSFTVALESTQMSMSKEGKTTNEIVFTPAGDGNLSVAVNGENANVTVSAAEEIRIALSEAADEIGYGNFIVSVNESEAGEFTNIGKYYAQYASSSADTPITPLTFRAATDSDVAFELHELNGQGFALNEDGKITDDQAPALVINSEIKQLLLGTELSFDTVTIDVCSSSVSTSRYYLADGVPVTSDDETVDPSFDEDGELVGYNTYSTSKRFFESDFNGNPGGTISFAYKLTDGNDNSAYYFIEWYADETALDENGHLRMVLPGDVNSYPVLEFPDPSVYQEAVTAAALQDGKSIQVGSGAYYYIPSLRPYVQDETCGYTSMRFTVYYRTASSDTKTVSGDYDELRIELTAQGTYEFRVVPINSAGNAMVGEFENSKTADITTSNVWDAQNLTTFRFSVQYNGPSIEEPEDGEVGYVDVSYSIDSFEIIALSGFQTRYKLYYLEVTAADRPVSVSDVRAAEQADGTNTYGVWKEINVYDSALDDGDENNDNDYSWDPDTSLSFVPQEIGFYKVVVEVASENLPVVSAMQVINITSDADVVPGESYWLQDNILSVIFLGIGVLCLIGIVIVALIKPKDKAAIEEEKARKQALSDKRESRK